MNKKLIEQLQLQAHPEGGYFRRTYVAEPRLQGERSIASAIYYYLDSEDFSAWHRLDADEMLHFYSGTSVTVHQIDEAGELTHVSLGDPRESPHLIPQLVVPRGYWFALEVDCENTYCLLGTTVFPEFVDTGFELAKRAALLEQFPQHEDIIIRLTRE